MAWLLVLVGLGACSGESATPGDVADADVASEVADATTDTMAPEVTMSDVAADTNVPSGDPILERSATITTTCTESLAPTQPPDHDWQPITVADVAGELWALRLEHDAMALTHIATDATLGTSYPLTMIGFSTGVGSARVDGTVVTLVWAEYLNEGGQVLRHARVDTQIGVTVAAHSLPDSGGAAVSAPVLVAGDGDEVLMWSSTQGDGMATLHFVHLDASGAFVAAPVTVTSAANAWSGLAPMVARVGDDYAVAWTAPNASSLFEVWFARLDASGTSLTTPRRISPVAAEQHNYGPPWEAGAFPLLAVGDDVWLVYAESYSNNDFVDPKGGVDMHLAVIGRDGGAVVHPVNRHVDNVSQTQASLRVFGDAVALTWVAGTTIYICGGCFVDYDIKTVLLDPATLTPVSAVATHTHATHGYRRPMPFVLGPDLATIASQDFHALSFPVIAVMHCADATDSP